MVADVGPRLRISESHSTVRYSICVLLRHSMFHFLGIGRQQLEPGRVHLVKGCWAVATERQLFADSAHTAKVTKLHNPSIYNEDDIGNTVQLHGQVRRVPGETEAMLLLYLAGEKRGTISVTNSQFTLAPQDEDLSETARRARNNRRQVATQLHHCRIRRSNFGH